MIGSNVKHPPTLILVVALTLSGALLAGCGASSLKDSETAAEAQAAEVAEAAPAESAAEPIVTEESAPIEIEATTAEESTTDNAGAWSVIQDGAQTFAGRLDQANQSVASCQTDAAAGADFDACVGKAYTAISAAAEELSGTVDQAIAATDGPCRDALTTLRGATQSLVDDYSRAVTTTDLTSRETLEARLGDDTQAYADDALAAAAACVG
jgi:hypothetical protein